MQLCGDAQSGQAHFVQVLENARDVVGSKGKTLVLSFCSNPGELAGLQDYRYN